ncbi:MAG: PBP1A family penicillin-binding protein [Acidobacteriota bacterium]
MGKSLNTRRADRVSSTFHPRSKPRSRRILNFLVSPYLLVPLALLLLVGSGVLTYYYYRYTELIDAGLRGDIFVRSSGIYAAPPELRSGASMKMNSIVAHLRRIGYVEGGSHENERRGQYAIRGAAIEIRPGSEARADDSATFRPLRVTFGRGGDVIQSIKDLENDKQMGEAPIEPELISSVINPEREKRKIIEYKDLPQNLVDAIVVVEDRQFFEHSGINWRGIVRAAIRDYQTGQWREGGSSVTQQLVKNFYLKPEKTPKRKLAEAYISILLEQRLTKEQIMGMYCNQIYLGHRGGFSINGFGQAARSYFDKDISHLSLAESALLAGVIRNPAYYSPFSHEDRAIERRNFVIEKLAEAGKITPVEAEQARQSPVGLKGKGASLDVSDAPYFIDYLTRQLESQYDGRVVAARSLRIYSTLQIDLQRAAYQAVTKHMATIEAKLAKRKGGTAGLQAALVALNPKTGEIFAMLGGRDYASSQLNRATDSRRQPGSVFKPFVYAAALSQTTDEVGQTLTPATMFLDAPHTFENGSGKPYKPGNFGDKYEMKQITLRDALANSKNVITVELAERIGFTQVARLAERAGLPKVPTNPSMALGVGEATPLQMAGAYTVFANKGRRVSPIAIKRVALATGATLFRSESLSREVISPQVAYVMTSLMEDVINHGTGSRVRQMGFKAQAAGKTGSSRDGWFAGYTPNLLCVVWVGFDDNSDLGLTGGMTAAPIWGEFMKNALALHPELGGEFEDPGDILTVDIDPTTGQVAADSAANIRHELFIRGTEPSQKALDTNQSEPAVVSPPEVPAPAVETPIPRSPASTPLPLARSTTTSPQGPMGTVSLDVCTLTGLIPLPGICPTSVNRIFPAGREPRITCRAAYHTNRPRLLGISQPR